MSDEERLLRSAAKGDRHALEELVRRLAGDVYRYLAGMLGDTRRAEEAMQEAFVRMTRALDRYDKGADVRAWVFAIARRAALDEAPSRSLGVLGAPPDSGDAAASRMWARAALAALPADLREVIVLRELMGWDAERMAPVLGLPLDKVPARVADGRKALLADSLAQRPPAVHPVEAV